MEPKEPKSNAVVQADHDNRRAPMQGDSERLAERGGFGYNEVVYLTGAPPKTYIPNHKGRTT